MGTIYSWKVAHFNQRRGHQWDNLCVIGQYCCFIRTTEKYIEKWRNDAKRAFALIPDIDNTLNEIQGKPASVVRKIVTLLADICRIVTIV